jgi:hypothetical protein
MNEENKNILVDSLKTLQGSNAHRHEDHAAFVDKINLEMSDVQKCSGELKIGRRSLLGRRDKV